MTDTETSNRTRNAKLIGLALTTALAGVTLSGCATSAAPTAAHSASKAETALTKGKHRSAVEYAEAAVLADPYNVTYRATLGAAYLDSGRFTSAADAFNDAITLGDTSSRTLLSLALAYSADGRQREAWSVLDGSDNTIAPSDLGLAYALAGQPERGIFVLTAALRGGENTAKVRQNLAYSYAIAGRWREARLMAAEDVPASQLGARMTEWATLAHPAAYHERIAVLLSVPVRLDDPGQPAQLALANFPTADQLAAETTAPEAAAPAPAKPVPVKVASAAPAAQSAAPQSINRELPPIGDPVDPEVAKLAFEAPKPASQASLESGSVYEPVDPEVAKVAFEAPKPASQAKFAAAFSQPAATPLALEMPRPAHQQAAAKSAPVTMDTARFAQQPAAKPAPAKLASAADNVAPKAPTPRHSQAAAPKPDTHLVQLGSFLNEAGARRAWEIYLKRYPELKGHDMVITRAVVDGKNYWRVSAAGYDAGSAKAMCGRVKSSGNGCFAYAEGKPLPGAIDTGRHFAIR